MKITVLRHAISIFNELQTSEKDCELSEAGKTQASDLSGNYDIVICSSMTRTKQTLLFSNITYSEVIYSFLCREYQQDICDFLPTEDENKKETNENLKIRVSLVKDLIQTNYSDKKVLLISHRDFLFELNGGTKLLANAEFQEIEI